MTQTASKKNWNFYRCFVGGLNHDFSNGNGAVNNHCRVYEKGEAEYERAVNAQQVVRSFPMHETSGGTFMAMNWYNDNGGQITKVTFQATSIQESYTLNDVHQALLQGTGKEDCKMDPSFVDFVTGGLIEDELDMYDRKCTEKMKWNEQALCMWFELKHKAENGSCLAESC